MMHWVVENKDATEFDVKKLTRLIKKELLKLIPPDILLRHFSENANVIS